MFLVHQIRFHCSARPNVYVTNDQSSSVPKNVCSLPEEKFVGWLFKIFCQCGHEKKNSEVETKLVMSVKSTSAPWKKKWPKMVFQPAVSDLIIKWGLDCVRPWTHRISPRKTAHETSHLNTNEFFDGKVNFCWIVKVQELLALHVYSGPSWGQLRYKCIV